MMQQISRIKKRLRKTAKPPKFLQNAQYYLYRDWLKNPRSRRLFEAERPALNDVQTRIVTDLRSHGVATARIGEFLGDAALQGELESIGGEFAAGSAVREQIQRYRAEYDKAAWKEYLVRMFPSDPTLSLEHPLMRFALNSRVLDTVNTYLGLWTKVNYADVWYTIEQPDARSRVGSQRWHRDPEDESLIKVFLYFSDVDEGAGPLEYVPGSASRGPHANLWRKRGNSGQLYVDDAEIDRLFPASERFVAKGASGMMLFCDTSGLHRGGHATTRPRIFATWCFVSPASLWPRRFTVSSDATFDRLGAAARFALV